ncbi:MAG TPA: transglutaminase family protein [Pseudolabrys sp.]|nr:transglutaminase family protein [Pseudolabrys sp.]
MIYDIRQVTTYRYGAPVAHARHVLRLTPIDRAGQRVNAAALEIDPVPLERRESRDFFGNRITTVLLDEPHECLSVRVAARIVVERGAEAVVTPAWEAVREAAFASADPSPLAPAHYLFPSRLVSLDPEIRDYVAESFPAGRALLDGAVDLMHRIKSEFTYELGATTATTTPPMSFALRRGVCQDFSHVMISGMRGLGLPVAYVSGYLRTSQPGTVRLEGADAMHAWVMAWCGEEAGWIGLDPTNDMLAGDDHVVLAIGRDYADVAPIDGVIVGGGGQKLEVSVRVTPI